LKLIIICTKRKNKKSKTWTFEIFQVFKNVKKPGVVSKQFSGPGCERQSKISEAEAL